MPVWIHNCCKNTTGVRCTGLECGACGGCSGHCTFAEPEKGE